MRDRYKLKCGGGGTGREREMLRNKNKNRERSFSQKHYEKHAQYELENKKFPPEYKQRRLHSE